MSNLRVTTLTDTAEVDEAIEKYLNREIKGKQLREILKNFRGEAYSERRFKELKEIRRNLFKRPPVNQPKTVDQLKREREEKLRKEREEQQREDEKFERYDRFKKQMGEYLEGKLTNEEFRQIMIDFYGGVEKGEEQFKYFKDEKERRAEVERKEKEREKKSEELLEETENFYIYQVNQAKFRDQLEDFYGKDKGLEEFKRLMDIRDRKGVEYNEAQRKYVAGEINEEEFKTAMYKRWGQDFADRKGFLENNKRLREEREANEKNKVNVDVIAGTPTGIEVTTGGGTIVMPRTSITPAPAPSPAPAPAPTPAPSKSKENQNPSNKQAEEIKEELKRGDIDTGFHDEFPNNSRNTINYENLSDIFRKTIRLADGVYSPNAREMFQPEGQSYYFSEYDTPFLIHKQGSTLYLAIRGTDFIDAKDGTGLLEGNLYATFSNVMTDANVAGRIKGEDKPRLGDSPLISGQDPILNPILSQFLPQSLAEIKFHSGMLQAIADIYPELRRNLDKFHNLVNDLVITGHSLGGGMSAILYYIYRNDITFPEKKIKVSRVITYGSPRILVNRQDYIDNYNGRCGRELIRVWNKFDLVTYAPFNNVSSQLLADIVKFLSGGMIVASGFTHIGKSFCLNGDYQNQNINLLIQETLRRGGDILKVLLENKENVETSKLINFMLSEKYEELLLKGLCIAGEKTKVKNNVNGVTLRLLALKLQQDSEQLFSYAEKCKLLERFNLEQLLLNTPIGEDPEQEDYTVASLAPLIFGMYTKKNKDGSPHSTRRYRRLLYKLIARETNENIPINYPVSDSEDEEQEETENNIVLPTEKGNISFYLPRPKIKGVILNNVLPKGTFISMKE